MKLKRSSLGIKIVLIVLFAVSMAYLESTAVVYLRGIFGISGDLPLEPSNVDVANLLLNSRFIMVEMWREVATIIMLVTFAILVGHALGEKFAVFLLSFGLWDIFYYIFLRITVDWPTSFITRDVLFLIPVTWVAPVYFPLSVSGAMILLASFLFYRSKENISN